MASAALHHNCQVFVLDPWNEVDHNMGRLSETLYIEQSIRYLKKRMRKYGLILIIIAHPTKLNDGGEPTLYTISGSANWKNKAEHGIIIKRSTDENGNMSNTVEICIEKCKDHETMGIPGKVYAEFVVDHCDYKSIV
jgi:twinkle protein